MQQAQGAFITAAPVLLGHIAVQNTILHFQDLQQPSQGQAVRCKTVPLVSGVLEPGPEAPSAQPATLPTLRQLRSGVPPRERRERPSRQQQRREPPQPQQPHQSQSLPQGPPLVEESEAVTPNGVLCARSSSGGTFVRWVMPAQRMTSRSHKTAVSPEFELDLPGVGPRPFKILAALPRFGGGLELKCEALLPPGAGSVRVAVGVGSERCSQPMRAPVLHDFSEQSCCDLRGSGGDWDLLSVLGSSGKRFVVFLDVLP